jgi:teichuronic acid biosynthesis glycosyltransferase TuaG
LDSVNLNINRLISIIMPAYNAEMYIGKSIESVLYQTYPYWELLVIDDGSTDSTKDVVRKFLGLDSRIKYFYQDNGKQGKARNLGIEKSKGEYLAFLDSDDLWFPNKLEIQIQGIIEKDVDLIFCDSYIFSDDNSILESDKVGVKDGVYSGENAVKIFIECNRIPILTVLAKKSAIQKVGGFIENDDVQYGEDYHLWLKLLLNGSIFYSTDQVLAKYRVHSESVTMQDKYQFYKILELFYDLKSFRAEYSNRIEKKIRHLYIKLYKSNNLDKAELSVIIEDNVKHLSKSKFLWIYFSLNWILPPIFTVKFLVYVLNGYIYSKWR